MPPVIQLFLCIFLCAIALTCSFRSSFFRFSPQRQGPRVPTQPEKGNFFTQRWGKTTASNVRFPIALSTTKDMVNNVDVANDFLPHFGLNKSSRKRFWSDDEVPLLHHQLFFPDLMLTILSDCKITGTGERLRREGSAHKEGNYVAGNWSEVGPDTWVVRGMHGSAHRETPYV